MPTPQQTVDQQRAAQAWEYVSQVNGRSEKMRKGYGSLAKKSPSYVLSNGLGQALAFLLSKGKGESNHYQLLYDHLSEWVGGRMKAHFEGQQTLLPWLLQRDSATYRRATVETLAFLSWIKRFSEATLPTEEEVE